jgi:hypothetical protein
MLLKQSRAIARLSGLLTAAHPCAPVVCGSCAALCFALLCTFQPVQVHVDCDMQPDIESQSSYGEMQPATVRRDKRAD